MSSSLVFSFARSKIVQVIFFSVLVVSFAFVGIEAYFTTPAGQDTVAEVGSQRITTAEFDQALRQQQDRIRGMLGPNFDSRMFESKEARMQIVDDLVNQKLIVVAAERAGASVSDVALAEQIAKMPDFHEGGKFSADKYASILKANGRPPKVFEAAMRKDMERTLFVESVTRTGFASGVSAELFVKAMDQSREVSLVTIPADPYLTEAKISAERVKAYYDQNKAEFTVPEQVRAEYVELSLDALAGAEAIAPEDVKKAYDSGYAAKHEEKLAARKKAEEVLSKARKEPKRFADLAREYSQDPGSAQSGGSLGAFGKGAMVKPFEDAVFNKLKVDQISDLVETDFGFHIIKLTGIKPKKDGVEEQREASHILISAPKEGKSFEQAKAEIERNLRRDRAGKKFAEVAQVFSDRVFEQSGSLKPVADELKLAIRATPWMGKGMGFPPFNNPKLSQALFSDEVLKNKRNTEAVEIAPNVLVAARAVEVKPAEIRPLASVEADIQRKLQREEAGKLAQAEGEKKLKALKEGVEATVTWPAPLAVSRQKSGALNPQVLDQVLKASVAKLPAYLGVKDGQGGYTLVRISKIIDPPAPDAATLTSLRQRTEQALLQEELAALLAHARKETGVKVRASAVEFKPQ
ncbi:MAG: SurA N-terminal domain-containing protein [Betaproteobacteria bacterium]|nr:SurA N-terminal domain-containing protein [Betaproteobacteria bacterium]